jgi:nucleotide-binding universal stress UspA family protein
MNFLVYVDPTHRGGWAMSLAQDLATGFGGKLTLLTVDDNLAADPGLLDRAAEQFAAIASLEIERKTRPGPPREAILAESREIRPAITIVPPAGRSRLARMIKGSRVKTVVHSSPSTVMVARQPVSDHIRSILVTVSGGPMSETTALSALEIAQALHAQITLLHVSSAVHIPFGGQDPETDRTSAVHRIAELLKQGGVPPRIRQREGMVVNEILAECDDGGYDLLILGQHLVDRSAGGAFSENIAEDLAMECPIPVLVVRPRRWAEDPAADSAEASSPSGR